MALDKHRDRVVASLRDRSEEHRRFCVGQSLTLAREAVARHLIYCTEYGLATWKRHRDGSGQAMITYRGRDYLVRQGRFGKAYRTTTQVVDLWHLWDKPVLVGQLGAAPRAGGASVIVVGRDHRSSVEDALLHALPGSGAPRRVASGGVKSDGWTRRRKR